MRRDILPYLEGVIKEGLADRWEAACHIPGPHILGVALHRLSARGDIGYRSELN